MNDDQFERISEISAYFTQRSDYWEEIYSKDSNPPNFMIYELFSRKSKVLELVDLFANNKILKILDVGSGTGHYLEEFIIKGHNVYGVDVAIGMLHKSRIRLSKNIDNPNLLMANINNLPFPNEYFDIILCVGVLEYLPNDRAAVKELRRILSKKGRIILTAPNILSFKFLTDPYYSFNRGWKFLLKKLGLYTKSGKKENGKLSIGLNEDFKNKRYLLIILKKLFRKENLLIEKVVCVSFGPPGFWLKPFLPLQVNIRLSNLIINLSSSRYFSLLKYIANRWAFCIKKEN